MDHDHELIAAVAAGDDTALRELFARHAPWLAARLRAVLPAADVEDVLQETFLAVWQGARSYRPEGAGAAWLWGIARRQAAQWLRRRGRAADLVAALAQVGDPGRPRSGRGRAHPGRAGRRRGGTGSSRGAGTRSLAAGLRTGPPGRRGSRAHGGSGRDGEEPGTPDPAPAQGGTAAGGSGRYPMSDIGTGATPPPDVDLDRVWIGVAAQVWRRQPGPVERTAGRLLRSPGLARALLATPSLLLPWLIASVAVLAVGAVATRATGQPLVALHGAGGGGGRHRLRLRARHRPGVGAVAQHGGQRPDGAAGAGARGVRRERGARPCRVVRVGYRGRAHVRLADPDDRGVRAGPGRGDRGQVAERRRRGRGGRWTITLLSGQAATGQFTAVLSSSALVPAYLAVAAVCAAVVAYATRLPKGTT